MFHDCTDTFFVKLTLILLKAHDANTGAALQTGLMFLTTVFKQNI